MRWKPYSAKDHDLMARLWADGVTAQGIAHTCGRTVSGVYYYARTHREDFPYRKLEASAEEHAEIVELAKSGWPARKIADYMGTSETTIRSHIKKERRA